MTAGGRETIGPLGTPKNEKEISLLSQLKQSILLDHFELLEKDKNFDDFFYLRWLRARNLDFDKSKEMLVKYLKWRNTCPYLSNLHNWIVPTMILNNLKHKYIGLDYNGRPVFCYLGGRVKVKELFLQGLKEEFRKYVHQLLEDIREKCEEMKNQAIIIMDLEGFSISESMNLDTIQNGMYFARILESCYPELQFKFFVVNANWLFSSFYNLLKPLLARITLEKVVILPHDIAKIKSTLSVYISPDSFPIEYGGNVCSKKKRRFGEIFQIQLQENIQKTRKRKPSTINILVISKRWIRLKTYYKYNYWTRKSRN